MNSITEEFERAWRGVESEIVPHKTVLQALAGAQFLANIGGSISGMNDALESAAFVLSRHVLDAVARHGALLCRIDLEIEERSGAPVVSIRGDIIFRLNKDRHFMKKISCPEILLSGLANYVGAKSCGFSSIDGNE